jgi:hypothetical protein
MTDSAMTVISMALPAQSCRSACFNHAATRPAIPDFKLAKHIGYKFVGGSYAKNL